MPTEPALVEQALAAGRARCEAAGESWTEPRRRTYALLVGARKPVKAYDLIQQFARGQSATKPPTVYRSLDLLMTIGLVQKVITWAPMSPSPT
jgi:Fur family zinc uptake transcriptional regulator